MNFKDILSNQQLHLCISLQLNLSFRMVVTEDNYKYKPSYCKNSKRSFLNLKILLIYNKL